MTKHERRALERVGILLSVVDGAAARDAATIVDSLLAGRYPRRLVENYKETDDA